MPGPPTAPPLHVFIHVPKTGGSALNRVLKRRQPKGIAHCEAVIGDRVALQARLREVSWISGHVSLDRMRMALSQVTCRKLKFFSALREPTRQVASHYNWLIEIFHRGRQFYESHPPGIRGISARIRETDNSDPGEIIKVLRQHWRLFLNLQSRMILADYTVGLKAEGIVQALAGYDFICTEDNLPRLAGRMLGRDVTGVRPENVSAYHFDRAVFRTAEMQAFLDRHNRDDRLLYETLCRLELEAGQEL